MLDFREAHSRRHALQGLPDNRLGRAGLASVVEPQHQQEDLLVLPHTPHLPALEAGQTVASHGFHSLLLFSQVEELHHWGNSRTIRGFEPSDICMLAASQTPGTVLTGMLLSRLHRTPPVSTWDILSFPARQGTSLEPTALSLLTKPRTEN